MDFGLESISILDLFSNEAQVPYIKKSNLFHAHGSRKTIYNPYLCAEDKQTAILSYCCSLVRKTLIKDRRFSASFKYNNARVIAPGEYQVSGTYAGTKEINKKIKCKNIVLYLSHIHI